MISDILTKKELEQVKTLGIVDFYTLIAYFPHKYQEESKVLSIRDAKPGDSAIITGTVADVEESSKSSRLPYIKAVIEDETGTIDVIWWNSPFVLKFLQLDRIITLVGNVESKKGKLTMSNPKIDTKFNKKIEPHNSLFKKEEEKKPLTAVYKDNKIIKHGTIKKLIHRALASKDFENLKDVIPEDTLKTLKLPNLKQAILMMHFPKDEEVLKVARKFFAFQEIFILQVYREKEKALRKNELSHKLTLTKNLEDHAKKLLPFRLTGGQEKVFQQILTDIAKDRPMSRLVEGDVGSGKTALALLCLYVAVNNHIKEGSIDKRLQTALMAPTEVLASQHFETFIKILKDENITIALLAKNVGKVYPSKIDKDKPTTMPKPKIKKLLEEGRVDILIGTHSVIQKTVAFKRLGLLVIDEQHRFGIQQRRNLIERSKGNISVKIPHLLSMSATPIPRTLALTVYGDLDLSILGELPPGRKRATTYVAGAVDREKIYTKMREYLDKGKQVYIICAKVDGEDEEESDKESKIKNVKEEYLEIQKKFKDYNVGLLYGKQPKQEKERVLEQFYQNDTQILVATSVVEVGISVPNATFMIIENAERFGLSQLHQLRGRVERSTDESLCYLMSATEGEKSLQRLEALSKTNNGFELAEVDLAERGAGSLLGKRQAGMTDIGMEAIKNRKLVEIAKTEAEKLVSHDPHLQKKEHTFLAEFVEALEFHEE